MNELPWGLVESPQSSSHAREQHFRRLQRITTNHRAVELYGVVETQLAQGRPDVSWSPCGDSRCESSDCTTAPFHRYEMFFKHRAKDKGRGPEYIWQTIDRLADVVWPGGRNTADKMSRNIMLGSFFRSPPVTSAYYLFREGAGRARLKADRKHIQAAICQASPFVEKIIGEPDLTVHHNLISWYLGPGFENLINHRTLADVVVKYMLLCETWRRYPSKRNQGWEFGSPRVICDLYGGILLGMRSLELFKLVHRLRIVNAETRNRVWDKWIKDFPLSAVVTNPYLEDDFIPRSACGPAHDDIPGRTEAIVLEEVGYLGGVGTYVPTVRRKMTRRVDDEVVADII